ncbi:MAG: 50S ribosomal protein L36 [Defluviicoccus sp.]|nr:MAG: 50S ribosomal protein L36 [Defluviicoccus sp.]
MKIRHSIKSAKTRERSCVVVRRKGRLYVLNKKHPRYKTRQG